jgi:hypothetical protein
MNDEERGYYGGDASQLPPPVYDMSSQASQLVDESPDLDLLPPEYPQNRVQYNGYQNMGFVQIDG